MSFFKVSAYRLTSPSQENPINNNPVSGRRMAPVQISAAVRCTLSSFKASLIELNNYQHSPNPASHYNKSTLQIPDHLCGILVAVERRFLGREDIHDDNNYYVPIVLFLYIAN